MKKSIFIIAILMSFISVGRAQSAKSIFFELGGPGLASINFDTRFAAKEDGLGGRVGVGGFSVGDVGVIFIPVELNYLLGKNSRNYFEMGLGVTPVLGSDGGGDGNFSTTFGHLNFGYRLQPLEGGFMFRACITPVFGKGFFVPYYGGISFGYKF